MLAPKSIGKFLMAAALLTVAVGRSNAQVPSPEGIEFFDSGSPGIETIYLRGSGSKDPAGLLEVEVWANEVTDLFGLSFALQFPRKLLRYPKSRPTVFVEGPFLGEDGAVETALLVRQKGKKLIIGHSRLGDVGGVSGSGHLMTLEFRGLGVAGKKQFRLRNTKAFDPLGAETEGTSWLKGKVEVTVQEPDPAGDG